MWQNRHVLVGQVDFEHHGSKISTGSSAESWSCRTNIQNLSESSVKNKTVSTYGSGVFDAAAHTETAGRKAQAQPILFSFKINATAKTEKRLTSGFYLDYRKSAKIILSTAYHVQQIDWGCIIWFSDVSDYENCAGWVSLRLSGFYWNDKKRGFYRSSYWSRDADAFVQIRIRKKLSVFRFKNVL